MLPAGDPSAINLDMSYHNIIEDVPARPERRVVGLVRSLSEGTRKIGLYIAWKDVYACVQDSFGKTKELLYNVSGLARPGRLLAIMGPSGAGKSTLMDVLSGNVAVGRGHGSAVKVKGRIEVNGAPMRVRAFRDTSCYVQQQEVLVASATVREALTASALLKLPRTMSAADIRARVEAVIDELDLGSCAGTLIGDAAQGIKGISGGQKRRVSVGVELVKDPRVLFLDEPTSGLDSDTAASLMATLRSMARIGRTVVCTIHQPNSEITQCFDDLVLLAAGRLMYGGPYRAAVEYFARSGLRCPAYTQPTEYFLSVLRDPSAVDTLAAAAAAASGGSGGAATCTTSAYGTPSYGADSTKYGCADPTSGSSAPWSTYSGSEVSPREPGAASLSCGGGTNTNTRAAGNSSRLLLGTSEWGSARASGGADLLVRVHTGSAADKTATALDTPIPPPPRVALALETEKGEGGGGGGGAADVSCIMEEEEEGASVSGPSTMAPLWLQVLVLAQRYYRTWIRSPAMMWSEISQYAFYALFFGTVFARFSSDLGLGVSTRAACTNVSLVMVSFTPSCTAVHAWGTQRRLLKHELDQRLYSMAAYYLARYAVLLPLTAIECVLFSAALYFLAGYHLSAGAFFTFVAVFFLFMVVSEGLGAICGAVTRSYTAGLVLLNMVLLLELMFTGFLLPPPVYYAWLGKSSYATHAYNLILEKELNSVSLRDPASGELVPGSQVLPQYLIVRASYGQRFAILAGWAGAMEVIKVLVFHLAARYGWL